MSLWPDGNGFAGQIWPAGRSLENHGLKRTPEQAQCFLRYKAEVRPYLISQTDRKIIRSQGFHFICDQHQQDFVRGFQPVPKPGPASQPVVHGRRKFFDGPQPGITEIEYVLQYEPFDCKRR